MADPMKLDDSDMDVSDDDGGVALIAVPTQSEVPDTQQGESAQAFFHQNREAILNSHQNPEVSSDANRNLWKVLVVDISHEADYQSELSKQFYKHCGLIRKYWHCNILRCVPAEVCDITPYSFIMLASLRRLSSSTKQDPELAHSLLLQARQMRLELLEQAGAPITALVETKVMQKGMARFAEASILESPYGLMLEDVRQATQRVRAPSLADGSMPELSATKAAANAATAAHQKAGKERKREAKQRRREARLQHMQGTAGLGKRVRKRRNAKQWNPDSTLATPHDELVGLEYSSVAFDGDHGGDSNGYPYQLNNPATDPTPPLTRARGYALRQLATRHNEQAIQSPPNSSDLANPEAGQDIDPSKGPTKRDRQQDLQLSNILDKTRMIVDGAKQMKRPRKGRLRAGGLSRREHGGEKRAMPSEQVGFAGLPSLRDIAERTTAGQMERLGQMRLDG